GCIMAFVRSKQFNRMVIVNEIKLAIPMNESDMDFVSSIEVENRDNARWSG
ncbi:hypothetical protein ISN45_Aa03g017630, partial [Arabidopsis thaliana x Arabidopsis arenosa]